MKLQLFDHLLLSFFSQLGKIARRYLHCTKPLLNVTFLIFFATKNQTLLLSIYLVLGHLWPTAWMIKVLDSSKKVIHRLFLWVSTEVPSVLILQSTLGCPWFPENKSANLQKGFNCQMKSNFSQVPNSKNGGCRL